MLVKVSSAAIQGIEALPVQIEVHLCRGIRFSLVGLPDNAVRESHERIVSALQINGLDLPRKQIIINMSPADIRKEGTSYDLPMLVGIMTAGELLPEQAVEDSMFIGELSLDGELQPVRGVLSVAVLCRNLGLKRLILPVQNAAEASLVEGVEVYGIRDVRMLIDFLTGDLPLLPHRSNSSINEAEKREARTDFMDVRGQEYVKRALEVACAGGHNLIMVGPPGAGKTMMANCISGILPPMTMEEAIETTQIHSVAGKTDQNLSLLTHRPFRSPHHSISSIALIGGGYKPQPGEISLAHNGVLFLDELPEFQRSALEVLRQPLEEGTIRIARANYAVDYPAGFMLVASMNPCPCGYYNHPEKACVCTPVQIQRYMNRISGPLMDRIDLQIEIIPVAFDALSETRQGESSESIRERVCRARELQLKRFQKDLNISCNARMSSRLIRKYVIPDTAGTALLRSAMQKLNLSARAYDRILKVSRTIADLEGADQIQACHVAEAIQYRILDKGNWGK